MKATELAILKLREGHDELELRETLSELQQIQDEWMRQNQPSGIDGGSKFSSMYMDDADPPSSMLITAPWDRPEAHGEWIQSPENQVGFAKLSAYLQSAEDSVLLFHMDPAGREEQVRDAFVPHGTFNLCRISVDPSKKDELQREYSELEEELKTQTASGAERLWAGWRIEKAGEREELVVLWSDGVDKDKLSGLVGLADETDHRRFRHIV